MASNYHFRNLVFEGGGVKGIAYVGALRQLEALTRRAPNSADVRAAAAALYYSAGRYAEAEDAWERACSREAGCAKYKDLDYVRRIRRWPPAMVGKLEKFLELKS